MTILALVNEQTNVVENVSLDDRPANEIILPGYIVVDITDTEFGIGDTWDGTKLVRKPPYVAPAQEQPTATGVQEL